MRRIYCGSCGDADIEVFLDLGSSPLANDLPKTVDQPQERFPLRLGVCHECWLVQMMDVVPHDLVFGGDYTFYSSTSPALQRYHKSYAERLIATHLDDQSDTVLEIACNDGDLLWHFGQAGYATLGIDPAGGPIAAAKDRGLDVLHASFGSESADVIVGGFGQAKLVIANHVTAHVIDLLDFFSGVQKVLALNGVAVLEVQYLPDLLTGNQFDHVYHEHRYFFSLTSLTRVAELVGLKVADVRLVEPQGGSVQVTLRHAVRANECDAFSVAELLHQERFITEIDAYRGMQMRAERVRERLYDLLDGERGVYRTVVGYGMPAKATTLLNFCNLDARHVSHIEDTSPSKIGRYAPGTNIPVVAPGERGKPDTYLVFVWNYLRMILERETDFRTAGGRFIVPIPAPMIL